LNSLDPSGGNPELNGIWGGSGEGGGVYVVGDYGPGGAGVVYYYDGLSWNFSLSVPNAAFYGIWGDSYSDIFAVGAIAPDDPPADDDFTDLLIWRYDGTEWTPEPAISETQADGRVYYGKLLGVWGTSDSDVWAVGSWWNTAEKHGWTRVYEDLIVHYDGNADHTWTVIDPPSLSDHPLGLGSVWGSSPSNVFAVGAGGYSYYVNNALENGTGTLRYTGDTWAEMDMPANWDDKGMGWTTVSGTSSTDVWLVGGGPKSNGQQPPSYSYEGYIAHYDGSGDAFTVIDNPATTTPWQGLWIDPIHNEMFAAGYSGNSDGSMDWAGVWRCRPSDVDCTSISSWVLEENTLGFFPNAIGGGDVSHLFAVGGAGYYNQFQSSVPGCYP